MVQERWNGLSCLAWDENKRFGYNLVFQPKAWRLFRSLLFIASSLCSIRSAASTVHNMLPSWISSQF
jgi:hypothetical protein